MLKKSALVFAASLALSAASSFATPITFSTSTGVQPADVGIITLTQVDANTVDVLLDLKNSTYGIMNSGNDNTHTPFVFNLAGSETGVSASFIQPVAGTYTFGVFALDLAGGNATPFGSYGVAITDTAGNGSGKAYYGDLEFHLIRMGGLSTTDFTTNSLGYYFGADLTDGRNTGSQAWAKPDATGTQFNVDVPDAGSTALLLGAVLSGFGMMARRIKK